MAGSMSGYWPRLRRHAACPPSHSATGAAAHTSQQRDARAIFVAAPAASPWIFAWRRQEASKAVGMTQPRGAACRWSDDPRLHVRLSRWFLFVAELFSP